MSDHIVFHPVVQVLYSNNMGGLTHSVLYGEKSIQSCVVDCLLECHSYVIVKWQGRLFMCYGLKNGKYSREEVQSHPYAQYFD